MEPSPPWRGRWGMSMRPVLAGLALVWVASGLAACTEAGGSPLPAAAPTAPAEVVTVRTADGPVTVDVRSGRVVMDAAGAVPAGGWSSLFQTSPDGTGTSLRTLDPTTGAVASSIALKGSLSIRAVAGDGSMVALAKPPPAGTDVWTPVPRRH